MSIERWRPFRFERIDPFRDLLDVQNETTGAAMDRVWAPTVDMYETKDDLVVTAELPGVKPREIRIEVG